MQRRVGAVVIESIVAENPKFTAPMLLIHGLWCTAAAWRKCMGYFAHRGWSCHALHLRGHGAARISEPLGHVRFADYLDAVRQVITACDVPPVVVGHDLGGLLALHCTSGVRARIAIAPLVPRSMTTAANRALLQWRVRFAMWRSWPLPVPRGRIATAYFGAGVLGGTQADSGRVARELMHDSVPVPAMDDVPTLMMAGEHDPFSLPRDVEHWAKRMGATFREIVGAGHAIPWEPAWEERVSEIHRWLIRTLGEPLLAMRDEEEE